MYNISETFFFLIRTERDTIQMYIGPYVKYPLLLPDFNETEISWTNFLKNTQISKCIKIRPVEAELPQEVEQTDGRTDRYAERETGMKKLIVAFRKIVKNLCIHIHFTVCASRERF